MEESITISPVLPINAGTDSVEFKSMDGVNGATPCPNCGRLRDITNGASPIMEDDLRQSTAISNTPILANGFKNSNLDHWSLGSANLKVLETMVVSQVEAPVMGIIKVIQLRRAKDKNALSQQMVSELSKEIEEIHHQTSGDITSTRALIIGSAVVNVFCSGADLKERASMSLPETRNFLTSLRNILFRLSTLPVPTIACVSGVALGGGLELALSCHLRVFAQNASVGLPETRLAIIPGAGGTYRLPKIVGLSHALDLILTGRRVHADEALTMGLCHRLVASGHETDSNPESQRALSLDAGITLARQITRGGPAALRAALNLLIGGQDALENAAYEAVLSTEDRNEGLQAFLEKRAPVFHGR